MTDQTFTALFDTYAAALAAIARLGEAGIPRNNISLVSNDAPPQTDADPHAGTTTGASLGTLLGGGAGLLAGLGMLALPGLGPVVAAGWVAATVVGAGVGAAAGGMVGALTEAGLSHDDAQAYAQGIRRGGTLVTVRADRAQAESITGIFTREGVVDPDAHGEDWHEIDWSGDPTAPHHEPPSAERPVAGEQPDAAVIRPVEPGRVWPLASDTVV